MTLLYLLPTIQHPGEREAILFHNRLRAWKSFYRQFFSQEYCLQ